MSDIRPFCSRAQLAQDAFDAYTAAFLKMQRTLDFADGQEAARLWHLFLDLYGEGDTAAAARRTAASLGHEGPRPA